ncbi:hypothetical protein BYT27DRAFT_6444482 [Phlegmacium glaucopus]|nr:hypothetical protein BYT27DRAFT_6444482 [Phlegmacium glaucopus]
MLGAWLSETEQAVQQGLLGHSSPHSHLLFRWLFISRLALLYPPIFPTRIHSLATCLLSYFLPSFPHVVLCYRILPLCCIIPFQFFLHTLVSFTFICHPHIEFLSIHIHLSPSTWHRLYFSYLWPFLPSMPSK